MNFESLHPAEQLTVIMNRIYERGMTTTSGGNLSVHDENGDIWITPSGTDKGRLSQFDICRVRHDGTISGVYEPSVELPFHALVYKKRPDIHAVIHAHPPALVSFSITRTLPDINLIASAADTLKSITPAGYATPGSKKLGEMVAQCFKKGFDIILLENHGVVVGAGSLHDAYMKLETLEFLANTEIGARRLGGVRSLRDSDIAVYRNGDDSYTDEFSCDEQSREESAARRVMAEFVQRCYRKKLFNSTQGTFSLRLPDDSFLITPHGIDRAYIYEADLVLIKQSTKEKGKMPSYSARLHRLIYDKNPEIHSVIDACPPGVMAFAVTNEQLNPRTIPESYIVLREMKKIPFRTAFLEPDTVADMFSAKTPVLICENDRIITTGNTALGAFDRLEVAEATAGSVLAACGIAGLVHISDSEIRQIDKEFSPE